MIKASYLLITVFHLISLFSFAQDSKGETEKFRRLAYSYNVEYTPQKGYNYYNADTGARFHPRKRQFANHNFALYNQKTDVMILMSFYLLGQGALYGSDQYVDSMANILPMRNFELNFGDTASKERKLQISEKRLQSINATAVNIIKVKVDFPYKQYGYVRSVNIQRQDLGGIQMYFLATDETRKKLIDREILRTWGMLKFRDDSLFKPPARLFADMVGKFRYLRPALSKDKMEKYNREKKVLYSLILDNEGEHLMQQHRYAEAVACYRQILDLNPYAEPSASRKLSEIYLKTRKPDSALFYAERLMVIDPGEPANQKALANYFAAAGEPEKGVSVFTGHLKQDMDLDHKTRFYLALFFKDNKLFKEAIEEFLLLERYFSEKKKSTGLILFCLGQAYQGLFLQTGSKSDFDTAKSYYLKAKEGGYEVPEEVLNAFGM